MRNDGRHTGSGGISPPSIENKLIAKAKPMIFWSPNSKTPLSTLPVIDRNQKDLTAAIKPEVIMAHILDPIETTFQLLHLRNPHCPMGRPQYRHLPTSVNTEIAVTPDAPMLASHKTCVTCVTQEAGSSCVNTSDSMKAFRLSTANSIDIPATERQQALGLRWRLETLSFDLADGEILLLLLLLLLCEWHQYYARDAVV
jgi:hypothetical protein